MAYVPLTRKKNQIVHYFFPTGESVMNEWGTEKEIGVCNSTNYKPMIALIFAHCYFFHCEFTIEFFKMKIHMRFLFRCVFILFVCCRGFESLQFVDGFSGIKRKTIQFQCSSYYVWNLFAEFMDKTIKINKGASEDERNGNYMEKRFHSQTSKLCFNF